MTAQRTFYVAASSNGANVYTAGTNCRDCDETFDPMYRNGVPCRFPKEHALNNLRNWDIFAADKNHWFVEVKAESHEEAKKIALAQRH